MIDKSKCKVCNRELALEKDKRYTAYDESGTGPISRMFIVDKMFDAFDCPYCGCQNIVNERLGIANQESEKCETGPLNHIDQEAGNGK